MKRSDPEPSPFPPDLMELAKLISPTMEASFRSSCVPAVAEPDSPPVPADAVFDPDEPLAVAAGAEPEVELLRTQQQYALQDLMDGASYTDAAQRAGVARRTLYRWVHHDPAFRSAMEAWRRRALRMASDRLTQAAEVAATTLMGAAARDFRAAAIVLKGLGLLGGTASAAPPVDGKFAAAIPPARRRAFEVRLRELILSFSEEMTATTAAAATTTAAADGKPGAGAGEAAPGETRG